MKIIIKNFKKYKDKTVYEFSDNEINLLSGPSGSGKSTIFKAIAWCLYGRESNIYPKDELATKVVSVKLIISNITIQRTKPPDKLKIILEDNTILVDKEADSYIYSFFGSKGLWYSSSYICQDTKNPLITYSNYQKFELLKELTFGISSDLNESNQEPGFYEEKVKFELNKIKNKILDTTSKYNGYKESYDYQIENLKEDLIKWNYLEDTYDNFLINFKKVNKKYLKTNTSLDQITEEYNSSLSIETSNNLINKNLIELNQELSNINILNEDKINELKENLYFLKIKKELENLYYLREHDELDVLKEINRINKIKYIYESLNLKNKDQIKNYILSCNNYKNYLEQKDIIDLKNKEIEYKIQLKNLELSKVKENEHLCKIFNIKIQEYEKNEKLKKDFSEIYYLKSHDFVDEEKEMSKLLSMKQFYLDYPDQNYNEIKSNYLKNKEFKIKKKEYQEYLKNIEDLDDLFFMKIHEDLNTSSKRNIEINKLINLKNIYKKTKTSNKKEIKEKYEKYIEAKNHNDYVDTLILKKEKILSEMNLKKIYELEYDNYLNYKKSLDNYNSLKKEKDELISLAGEFSTKKSIQDYIENLKDHKCPHCNNLVYFKDGILTSISSPTHFISLNTLERLLEIYDLPECPKNIKEPKKIKESDIEIPYKKKIEESDKNNLDIEIPNKKEESDKNILDIEIPNKKELSEKIEEFDMDNLDIDLKDIDLFIESINNYNEYFSLLKKTSIKIDPVEDINISNNIPESFNYPDVTMSLYEINFNIKSLNNKKEYYRLLKEIKELEYPTEPIYIQINNSIIKEDIEKIISLKIINTPILYEKINIDIDIDIDYIEIELKLKSLNNKDRFFELKKLIDNRLDINGSIEEIEKIIIDNTINYNKIIELNKNITIQKNNIIKSPKKSSEILKNEILELKVKQDNLKDLLNSSKAIIVIEEQKNNIKEKKDKILTYLNYEKNLNSIKSIIEEVSSNSMEEIIDSINNISNNILKYLFNESIYIELSHHKTLKSGNEKLQVNLKIIYNDCIYNNPSDLSGGENTRISFAITLALAKITGSKFLLLDECMSSLNLELREKSIKVLKHNFPNTTIINICHEIIKGIHDNFIEIS